MKVFIAWLLIIFGFSIVTSSYYTISVWPLRFQLDWQEWVLVLVGLIMIGISIWILDGGD